MGSFGEDDGQAYIGITITEVLHEVLNNPNAFLRRLLPDSSEFISAQIDRSLGTRTGQSAILPPLGK